MCKPLGKCEEATYSFPVQLQSFGSVASASLSGAHFCAARALEEPVPHLLLVQVYLERLAEAVGRRWQERIMLVTILNKSEELALNRKQQLAFVVL